MEGKHDEAKLVMEYMKLIWSCCHEEKVGEDMDNIAFHFDFLASQKWFQDDRQDNHLYLPEDYAKYVQDPHVDYNHTRDKRIHVKHHHDMWSMDLPLTKEGCTIMLWPQEGVGLAAHVKYDKVLLQASSLVHSGGMPGRHNSDAFRLHGALGTSRYLPEIVGESKTIKDDAEKIFYQTKHLFPSSSDVMEAINNRNIQFK